MFLQKRLNAIWTFFTSSIKMIFIIWQPSVIWRDSHKKYRKARQSAFAVILLYSQSIVIKLYTSYLSLLDVIVCKLYKLYAFALPDQLFLVDCFEQIMNRGFWYHIHIKKLYYIMIYM